MKKAAVFILIAGSLLFACNSALKTVDPTGKGPIPKGVRESQKDTSVTGRKDTTKTP